jgi:hypothetical protein
MKQKLEHTHYLGVILVLLGCIFFVPVHDCFAGTAAELPGMGWVFTSSACWGCSSIALTGPANRSCPASGMVAVLNEFLLLARGLLICRSKLNRILCADIRENILRGYNVACWVGGEKNHRTGAVDLAYYNLPGGKFRSWYLSKEQENYTLVWPLVVGAWQECWISHWQLVLVAAQWHLFRDHWSNTNGNLSVLPERW